MMAMWKICVFYFILFCGDITIGDPAIEQLEEYLKTHRTRSKLRTTWGAPVPDFESSLTVNPHGTLLLQDNIFLDAMAHFTREIQKERVVHPRGSGAFGVFNVTQDITKYTRAKLFESVGKETKIAVRFSKAISERGTPETVRDAHGFAVKFYTEEGTWDLTTTTAPVFFIRDPMLIPALTHALHRNPVTNIRLDSNMIWDFVTLRPDSATALLFFFQTMQLLMVTHTLEVLELILTSLQMQTMKLFMSDSIFWDVHGFAVKFYTEEGTWDLTTTTAPVFFIRDPMLIPALIHALHRNPVTNIRLDSNMIWDFVTLRPDSATGVLFFFSDHATPDGYRHIRSFGANTYKFANADHEAVYVRFHLLADQGIRNLTPNQAANLSVYDPDYYTRDLYNAIAEKNYPSYTLHIQLMTFEQAETFPKNPFDSTIQWSEEDFPLMEVGRLTLNENPKDYYSDVEQIAFNPAHMVPGIEASPDIILQARIFAYGNTQQYRLGVNYLQLPVNCPFGGGKVNTYMKEGPAVFYSQGGTQNYYPNSFKGPEVDPSAAITSFHLSGDVKKYNTSTDDFDEATKFWKSLSVDEQEHLVEVLVHTLKTAAKFLQERAVKMFEKVDEDLSKKIVEALQ